MQRYANGQAFCCSKEIGHIATGRAKNEIIYFAVGILQKQFATRQIRMCKGAKLVK